MTATTLVRFTLLVALTSLCVVGWLAAVPDASLPLDLFAGFVIGFSMSLYGHLCSLRNIHTNNLIIRGYQARAVTDQAKYTRLVEKHAALLKLYRDLGGEEIN